MMLLLMGELRFRSRAVPAIPPMKWKQSRFVDIHPQFSKYPPSCIPLMEGVFRMTSVIVSLDLRQTPIRVRLQTERFSQKHAICSAFL